jgi:hypothetical protein
MAAAAVVTFRTNTVASSVAAGDDGSNTDSGRGLSEEDVAELPPSVVGSSCMVPAGNTFGHHPEADDIRCYAETDKSDCRGRREAIVHRSSSSGSTTSAMTGCDTGKRVRFQTQDDSAQVATPGNVDRYRGNGAGGQQLIGAVSVWRRIDHTGDGFTRGGGCGRRWRTMPTSSDGNVGRLRVDDSYNDPDNEDDDDAGTTTSGSYDPTELCNEIDRVFFAHNTPI